MRRCGRSDQLTESCSSEDKGEERKKEKMAAKGNWTELNKNLYTLKKNLGSAVLMRQYKIFALILSKGKKKNTIAKETMSGTLEIMYTIEQWSDVPICLDKLHNL